MADSFTFELVSPEQLLVSREVTAATMPGIEGDFTVMADHAPFMTSLRAGLVTFKGEGSEEERFVVYGGFADVQNNRCTVLAEQATHIDEVDRDKLQERIERAQRHLDNAETDEERRRHEDYLGQLTQLDQNIVVPA